MHLACLLHIAYSLSIYTVTRARAECGTKHRDCDIVSLLLTHSCWRVAHVAGSPCVWPICLCYNAIDQNSQNPVLTNRLLFDYKFLEQNHLGVFFICGSFFNSEIFIMASSFCFQIGFWCLLLVFCSEVYKLSPPLRHISVYCVGLLCWLELIVGAPLCLQWLVL